MIRIAFAPGFFFFYFFFFFLRSQSEHSNKIIDDIVIYQLHLL